MSQFLRRVRFSAADELYANIFVDGETTVGAAPLDPDTDGDGVNDGDEVAAGRFPAVGVLRESALEATLARDLGP